ncbi:MAG: hypothetical protein KDA60_08645 [Planctomycetales bacterium]|nr:hypothetical protein [Planctomycetales bacterium]
MHRRLHHCTLFWAMSLAVVLAALPALADPLVVWSFTGLPAQPATSENTPPSNPILPAAEANPSTGLTTTDLTHVGLVYSTAVAPGGVGTSIPGELNIKNFDVGGDGNDNFLTYTLTADPGNVIDIDSMSVFLWRNGGGAPDGIAFDVSVDGGPFELYGDVQVASTTGGGVYDPFIFNHSITGAQSIDVRFAPRHVSAGSTGNLHILAMGVDGSVRVVPEPTAAVLLLLGVTALWRRDRRSLFASR